MPPEGIGATKVLYGIVMLPGARMAIESLGADIKNRLYAVRDVLQDNPRPEGCVPFPVPTLPNAYTYEVSYPPFKYQLVYIVEDVKEKVTVLTMQQLRFA